MPGKRAERESPAEPPPIAHRAGYVSNVCGPQGVTCDRSVRTFADRLTADTRISKERNSVPSERRAQHEVHKRFTCLNVRAARRTNWKINASIRLFCVLRLQFGALSLGQKVDSTPELLDVLPETINDVDDAFAEIIHKSHWVRVGF